jgi:peptide/nickel transport system ATP-binding protein
VRREMVYRALEEVRLTPPGEVAAKYPHMLSGGQRQRAAIARAIVLKPRYIVADEPVSMVDASSRAEILQVLKNLQTAHGIAFLYISHDLAASRYFSDRIAVMYLGRIVEMGPCGRRVKRTTPPIHTGPRQLGARAGAIKQVC